MTRIHRAAPSFVQLTPGTQNISSAPWLKLFSWKNTFQVSTAVVTGTSMGIKLILRMVLPILGIEYNSTANVIKITISTEIQITVNFLCWCWTVEKQHYSPQLDEYWLWLSQVTIAFLYHILPLFTMLWYIRKVSLTKKALVQSNQIYTRAINHSMGST